MASSATAWTALIGTSGLNLYDRARITIYHDAATVGEVDIVHRCAILADERGVIDRVTGAGCEGCLLGLLLRQLGGYRAPGCRTLVGRGCGWFGWGLPEGPALAHDSA